MRADAAEFGGDSRFVMNLDQESAPALFDKNRFGRPGGNFDARLGIDVDADEAVGIEDFLGLIGSIVTAFCEKGLEGFLIFRQEGSALVIERFGNTLQLRRQRLPFSFHIFGKHLRRAIDETST